MALSLLSQRFVLASSKRIVLSKSIAQISFFLWRFHCFLDWAGSRLFSGGLNSTTFNWTLSGEILGTILAFQVILNSQIALFSNQLAVGPITSLELWEYEHSFIRDFERSSPWNLLKVWRIFVIIWDEIVVNVKRKILLWDLIFHDHSVWNLLDDARSNLLEKFLVLWLVVTSVPVVILAVLAGLYYENYILTHYIFYL